MMRRMLVGVCLVNLLLMVSGCNTHADLSGPIIDDAPVVTPTATDYEFIVRKSIKKMP